MRNSFLVTVGSDSFLYSLKEWGNLAEAEVLLGKLRRTPGANLFTCLKEDERLRASEFFDFTESPRRDLPNSLRVVEGFPYFIGVAAPLSNGVKILFILYGPGENVISPIEGMPAFIL